jgi:hypothetical protein
MKPSVAPRGKARAIFRFGGLSQHPLLNPHGGVALSAGAATDVSSVAEYPTVAVSPIVISPTDITTAGAPELPPPVKALIVPNATMALPPTTAANTLTLLPGRRLPAISLPQSLTSPRWPYHHP